MGSNKNNKGAKQMKGKIVLYIIFILTIIFLLMNIKIRNDLIWQQRVEIEDLKEQIDRERINK